MSVKQFLFFAAAFVFPSAAFASGFVKKEGTVFSKIGFQTSTSDKKFAGIFDRDLAGGTDIGDRIDFDPTVGGESTTTSASITLSVVPLRNWEVGAYFPFFQVSQFSDESFTSETTGTGDLFLNTAYQITPVTSAVGMKLKVESKIPLTTLPAEFQSIPLGEGQFDIAVGQETSYQTRWGIPFELTASTLFRKRFPFEDGSRKLKFGDEFEVGAEVGAAPLGWIWVNARYYALFSTGTEDRSGQGPATLSGRRQLHELNFGSYVSFGRLLPEALHPFALDASVGIPIAGQDYPAGLTYRAGLAFLHTF